jgi:hypothetical protein
MKNRFQNLPFKFQLAALHYGLRTLAETNLMDLVASARTFAKESRKCRLFTLFCELTDDAARRGGGPYLVGLSKLTNLFDPKP